MISTCIKKKTMALAVAGLLLACCYQLVKLLIFCSAASKYPLHPDEMVSVQVASASSFQSFWDAVYVDNQHVLYYFFLRVWISCLNILSDIEKSYHLIRYPGILFGLLTYSYLFVWFKKNAGLFIALSGFLLFSYNYKWIMFFLYARPYCLLILLLVINFLSLVDIFYYNKRSKFYYILFIGSAIAIGLTHHLAMLYYPLSLCFILITKGGIKKIQKEYLYWGGVFTAIFLLFMFTYKNKHKVQWIAQKKVESSFEVIQNISTSILSFNFSYDLLFLIISSCCVMIISFFKKESRVFLLYLLSLLFLGYTIYFSSYYFGYNLLFYNYIVPFSSLILVVFVLIFSYSKLFILLITIYGYLFVNSPFDLFYTNDVLFMESFKKIKPYFLGMNTGNTICVHTGDHSGINFLLNLYAKKDLCVPNFNSYRYGPNLIPANYKYLIGIPRHYSGDDKYMIPYKNVELLVGGDVELYRVIRR